MLPMYLWAFLLHLGWAALGLADPTPTITIPFVADAPDYFQGYGGKVISAQDVTTTYAINCLTDNESCHRFTPDLTVVYAPSTYNVIAQGFRFDLTSACALEGSPTPTAATCIETRNVHADNSFLTATVIVPAAGADSTLGIYPAPLPVTDSGTFPGPPGVTATPISQNTASSTDNGAVVISGTPLSDSSTGIDIVIATGTLIAPTSGGPGGYLNATITSTGVEASVTNGTSPVGANGTVTVTMTVLASNIACHCACDCRNETSQQSTPTESMAAKSDAEKQGPYVALMGGLMFAAVLLIGL